MKTTKQLIAKVLKVTAQELTPYNESGECVEYVFNALEFCNGLVMVPSDTTNDWFFASSEDVEPGGMAVVTDIESMSISEIPQDYSKFEYWITLAKQEWTKNKQSLEFTEYRSAVEYFVANIKGYSSTSTNKVSSFIFRGSSKAYSFKKAIALAKAEYAQA